MLGYGFALLVLGGCAGYWLYCCGRVLRDIERSEVELRGYDASFQAIALAQARWTLEGHSYPPPAEELGPMSWSEYMRTLEEIRSL